MSKNIFPMMRLGNILTSILLITRLMLRIRFFTEVKRYGVAAYPNMLILDTEGNVLGRGKFGSY